MNTQNNKGFTLVEMAIVLVVIGLLVGMGAGLIGPLTTMSKTRESREVVEADITSIISWAASNNRLPDAVTNPLPPTNSTTYFTNALKSTNDSWGNAVYYLYSCALGGDNTATYGTFCTPASTFSKDTICGRKTTPLQIRTSPTTTISNVAFVVMSDMSDGVLTTIDGTINTIIGTTITSNTYIAQPITRSGAVTPRAGQTLATITLDPNVSDIVRWVTLDELRSKIGCQGAQLKILNNELPAGSATGNYSAIISVEGGVPIGTPDSYRWCIQPASGSSTPSNVIYQKPDSTGTPVSITNVANLNQTDCPNYPEGNWPVAGKLLLSWTSASAPTTNSYSFTIFVRDNSDTDAVAPDNDNIASKSFVLTINP